MASGKFRPGPFSRIVRGVIENLTRGKGPQGGVQVGTDPFGNRYFEIPADPSRGKRRPIRWYDAPNTNQKVTLIGTHSMKICDRFGVKYRFRCFNVQNSFNMCPNNNFGKTNLASKILRICTCSCTNY